MTARTELLVANAKINTRGESGSRRKGKVTSRVDKGRAEAHRNVRTLSIEWVSTKSLSPSAKNVRIHGEKQIAKIADSISAFGFICPIVVDSSGVILAGHGRYAAAQILQMRKVPVVQISHLNDTEKRLFALADNRLAELADWDEVALGIELKSLEQISVKLDLDIEVTGLSVVKISETGERFN